MNFSDEQKKILITVVVVGLLGVGGVFYYWYFFGKTKVETFNTAAVDAEEEWAALQEEFNKIKDFKKFTEGKYEELETMLAKVEKRLPQSREAIEFFEALNDILSNTGVINERLAADSVTEHSRYAEIPYSIKAVGRFHEFGQFLNLVEQNSDRFMRVKTLKVNNDSKRPSLHPIEVRIATFKFLQK